MTEQKELLRSLKISNLRLNGYHVTVHIAGHGDVMIDIEKTDLFDQFPHLRDEEQFKKVQITGCLSFPPSVDCEPEWLLEQAEEQANERAPSVDVIGDDKENLSLYSRAIVPKQVYRLPLAQEVKFSISQLGSAADTTSPRLEIFRGNPDNGLHFSIALTDHPAVVDGEQFLSEGEIQLVIGHIKKYRAAYLMLWHDTGTDIDDLRREMDQINLLDKA